MRAATCDSLCRCVPRSSAVRLLGFAAVVLLLCSPPARADVAWTPTTTGDWSAATNWSGGVVPTSSDSVDIYSGGTATISQTAACSALTIGGTTGSGNLQITGGSLTVSSSAVVGNAGAGSFTQSGGSNSISTYLFVGRTVGTIGGSGAYSLSDFGQLFAQAEYVGDAGMGGFTQSGGTNAISGSLFLAFTVGSGDLQPRRVRPVVGTERIRRRRRHRERHADQRDQHHLRHSLCRLRRQRRDLRPQRPQPGDCAD